MKHEFSEDALTNLFIQKLSTIPDYTTCLEIVQKNTKGKIWLIGGIVSRSLVEELYNVPQGEFDFDFLVEEMSEHITLPDGWTVQRKYHNNPTFVNKTLEIDIFPIKTHNYLVTHQLAPTIENFFKSVPFTIQAIAFDVNDQRIIGTIGIDALQKKEYRINNKEEAMKLAQRKGISINERITDKAKSMGLHPILEEQHI